MTLPQAKLPLFYLKPGEMYFGEQPTLVSTLLGSCISVVMFNRRLRFGAICHSLLPGKKGKKKCSCADDCTEGFRYVECSIRKMMKLFVQRNVPLKEVEVKIFGGSDMFNFAHAEGRSPTVGKQNIDMALQIIEKEKLRLTVSDVGGQQGRKLFFYTHTGEVLLKRLTERDHVEII